MAVPPPLDTETLKKEYDKRLPTFTRLETEAVFALGDALKAERIEIDRIDHRIKQPDSFLQKCENNQFKEPFEEITDIVGTRIVCLFLSDVERIVEAIRKSFVIMSEKDRIGGSEPSTFGYMDYQLVATFPKSCQGPRYEGLIGAPFKIQVRTLSMDAWAKISHHLDYKQEVDVPVDLKRDFSALSGLFYVADKHFEMFFKERQNEIRRINSIVQSPSPKDAVEINFDSMRAYLIHRFPDRRHGSTGNVSDLIKDVRLLGYEYLHEFDKTVDRALEAALAYERDSPPIRVSKDGQKLIPVRYYDVAIVRVLLCIDNEKYRRIFWPGRKDLSKYRKMIG